MSSSLWTTVWRPCMADWGMVCLLAALWVQFFASAKNWWSHNGIISSCQSDATSEIVKHFWALCKHCTRHPTFKTFTFMAVFWRTSLVKSFAFAVYVFTAARRHQRMQQDAVSCWRISATTRYQTSSYQTLQIMLSSFLKISMDLGLFSFVFWLAKIFVTLDIMIDVCFEI